MQVWRSRCAPLRRMATCGLTHGMVRNLTLVTEDETGMALLVYDLIRAWVMIRASYLCYTDSTVLIILASRSHALWRWVWLARLCVN